MAKKSTQFREMLNSGQTEFIMEAHNGLSAKIVEEAGFKGIWASGLSLSAQMGIRDNNEASWTQVLEVTEFMSDATDIPIMLDADTGYGNFNNMRRLVRKLEQRDIAAVCIEDKLFPKTNSFIDGDRQQLADIDEFAGKIKAAKDTQVDPDFCVVSRVEAFIAGWGIAEALKRAEAYYEAGTDAVLIHSKLSTADEIITFMQNWKLPCPVVIVPTMYYSTPTAAFEQCGVSLIIWANHTLRASIGAMQQVTKKIHEERSLLTVEDEIVPVREVFRLQGTNELKQAESEYLPSNDSKLRAVVLAASKGSEELRSLTDDRPKAMLNVGDKPILQRLVDHLNDSGISDVSVVVGYKPETVDVSGVNKILNTEYESTQQLYSLALAYDRLEGPVVVSYGDILFKKYVLLNLQTQAGDIVLVVDADSHDSKRQPPLELVQCSRPHKQDIFEDPVLLKQMDTQMAADEADGEWIGLMRLSSTGAQWVREAIDELRHEDEYTQMQMKDLFDHLISKGYPIHVVYIKGHWLDIDNLEVLSQALYF